MKTVINILSISVLTIIASFNIHTCQQSDFTSLLHKYVKHCVITKQQQNLDLLRQELDLPYFKELIIKLGREKLLPTFVKNLSFCQTPQARIQAVIDIMRYMNDQQLKENHKAQNALAKSVHSSLQNTGLMHSLSIS